MDTYKNRIIAICLLASFAWVPPARAQAQMAAPLIQLGMQMAAQLVPMLIPVAIGGAALVVRAGSTVPALVRERVPHPHFSGKKRVASSDAPAGEASEESYKADENVTGSVVNEGAEEASAAQKAGAEAEPLESKPAAQPRRAAKDASEWYMEED